MTNSFSEALCSNEKNKIIPEAYDYFGGLIGEWAVEWRDRLDDTVPRRVKGEWIFSRVLEGTAVQDLFIVPSRTERLHNPQADAEYGTTLRIYNPKTTVWDIFYGCTGSAFRLTAVKTGDEVVLTENGEGKMRYIFSEITADTFRWRKEYLNADGHWAVAAIVTAMRKKAG
ncbi:hypothetical protein HRI96_00550 [Treponema parvum]|uniref:DUF1579 domain-containing protein n=1 Tax=Treponema parvum TaxID=138851 RepID=A0A975IBE7_9SPIR|nr:hypothetical protein [Treponema parvum]QTQ10815.1 hypothetical protein HRI96_00550 [Treponema parvum]